MREYIKYSLLALAVFIVLDLVKFAFEDRRERIVPFPGRVSAYATEPRD